MNDEEPNPEGVKVGDKAPDFTLPSQSGDTVHLYDLLETKAVVLYFYPKDETPGCTAEACAFRDSYEVFREAGAEVVGVSSDSVASHEAFRAHHQLPFILLSDVGGKVRKLYGARSLAGLLPGRVTYIIDRNAGVRHVFSSQINAERHVQEALSILKPNGGPNERPSPSA
jgi:thioredoxin-dependent peroxiredoxin